MANAQHQPNANGSDQQPASAPAPDAIVAAIDKAREEERAKLAALIKQNEEAVKQAADRAAAFEKERLAMAEKLKRLELAQNDKLTPDQKLQKQLEDMQARIAQEREARQQESAALQQQLHAERIEAYRNRRMMEVGAATLIPAFVTGNTFEEIDQSIQYSQSEYQRLRQQHLAEFQQQFGSAPQGQGATNVVPSVVSGAPSEYYSPPRGGLPSGYAPPVPVQQTGVSDVQAMTSEHAVRSGEYAKHREGLFSHLQKQAQPNQSLVLGNAPRQYGATTMPASTLAAPYSGATFAPALPAAAYPNGVPVAARPAGVWGPSQPVAPAPSAASASEMDLAAAAIARTNSGHNPLVQQQSHLVARPPDGAKPVFQGNADAALAAYAQRFQHTPPVAQA